MLLYDDISTKTAKEVLLYDDISAKTAKEVLLYDDISTKTAKEVLATIFFKPDAASGALLLLSVKCFVLSVKPLQAFFAPSPTFVRFENLKIRGL